MINFMEQNNILYKRLLDLKTTLPSKVLADFFILRPDMEQLYTAHHKENFMKDVSWILSFLAETVWAGRPVLFEEFVSWLKTFLLSVKVPMKDLGESFELIKKQINFECNDEENKVINPILDKAIQHISSIELRLSIPAQDNKLSLLAENYLNYLLIGKKNDALALIMDKVKSGTPIKDIYMQVFQPVQYEIGLMWQTNKLSVAQEHYCTSATQLIMAQLYPYLFTGEKKNKKMIMACVQGELHEIGARMVTDFFEMSGWDTYYLGANMPVESLLSFIINIKPQLVAISATMTYHINEVEKMIRKIRTKEDISPNLKIIVGGYPFKIADGLWKQIGADGFALNATDAIELAEKLIPV